LPDLLPKPFQVALDHRDGTTFVRPAGELDMSTVPILEERLRAALSDGAGRLVVDLRNLEFMDSTGLALLARWERDARRDGHDLGLIRGEARVHRLFELTGLDAVFRFVEG
jgi:anti-sigma B factor antagonist